MNKLLEQLEKLDLPEGSFAIFGSGPMVVHGLRERVNDLRERVNDLDVIVRKDVWDQLAATYGVENKEKGQIVVGDIDIFWHWRPWLENESELIETAEMMDGWPYVRLEYVLKWKRLDFEKFRHREKDKKDVELIEEYLAK